MDPCGPPLSISLVPREHSVFSMKDLSPVVVLRATPPKRAGDECLQKVGFLALLLLPVQFGPFLSEKTQVLRPPGSGALPPHGDSFSPPLGLLHFAWLSRSSTGARAAQGPGKTGTWGFRL